MRYLLVEVYEKDGITPKEDSYMMYSRVRNKEFINNGITTGYSARFVAVDDPDNRLRTSNVVSTVTDGNLLIVNTLNSVYHFQELGEHEE